MEDYKNISLLNRFRQLPPLFWVPGAFVALLCLVGLRDTEVFIHGVRQVNQVIFSGFGGYYLWFVWLSLILFVLIGVSPLGKIRLGGADARPEHSFSSWFAMLFCAGMGTGFMFWGAAEPLYHFMNPPLSGSFSSTEKLATAFRYTFFHWGLHPWAIYGMTALAIAFLGFNLRKGLFFSSFLLSTPFPKRGIATTIRFSLDLVTIVAIVFGIAATIGMGVLQLKGGFQWLLNWKPGPWSDIGILAVVTAAYITSTLKGLEKGIKVLSVLNLWLGILLMACVVFLGPWPQMFQALWEAIPAYLCTIPDMSLGLGVFRDRHWVSDWTIKYWSWWIAWAPFVGLFIAVISKGRTIRELVGGVLVAPTLFSCFWFAAFGASAIHYQQTESLFGGNLAFQDVSLILFNLVERIAHSPALAWLGLALVAINFINSADSATYTISRLSTRDLDREPSRFLQLMWGLVFAGLAGLLLMTGGIEILQQVTMITVLPFTLILTLVFGTLIVALVRYGFGQGDRDCDALESKNVEVLSASGVSVS